MATAWHATAPGSHSNLLLRLLISLLEVIDAVMRWLYTKWYCRTRGIGPAKAAGINPPPPTVVGIIIAEPNAEDISLQMVAKVAGWCTPYDSVQQLHVYEPSGHLKRSQLLLEQKLAPVVEREGRSVVIQCGWSVAKPSYTASSRQQQQKQQQLVIVQQQQPARKAAQRSWGTWLTQQIVGADRQQHGAPVQQEALEGRLEVPEQVDLETTQNQSQGHQQQVAKCSNAQDSGWWQQQQPPEIGSTDTRPAAAGCGSYTAEHVHCPGSSKPAAAVAALGTAASAAALTLRLLSAEDAFLPISDAAAERCRHSELPGSPNARKQQRPQGHDQQPQLQKQKHPQQLQQQQGLPNDVQDNSTVTTSYTHCSSCSNGYIIHRCSSGSCPCSKHNGDKGVLCPCEAQVWDNSACCCPHCRDPKCVDRLAATVRASTTNSAQMHAAEELQEDALTGSSAQPQQRQSKQSLSSQQQQGQQATCDIPNAQALGVQQSASCLRWNSALQKHDKQQQKQNHQHGSVLRELAAVSSADITLEPQLLLVFGPVLTLAGYPPFHTRAAEVHYMGSLGKASRQAVAAAIARYCRVLQRHGA